jgi:hypothetical protein
MNILDPKIGALQMGLKNKTVIFSKRAEMTMIKFQQFVQTILNETVRVVSSREIGKSYSSPNVYEIACASSLDRFFCLRCPV